MDFRASLERNPSNYYAGFSHLNIGEMKFSGQYLSRALARLKTSTIEAPQNPDGWVLLGRAERELWRLGGHNDSLLLDSATHIKVAIGLSPYYDDAQHELADTERTLIDPERYGAPR